MAGGKNAVPQGVRDWGEPVVNRRPCQGRGKSGQVKRLTLPISGPASGCAPAGLVQPGAGLALCFGDFAGGHFLGNFGAAGLAFLAACERGEIEPFMRLDKIDLPARAGGIGDPEFEISVGIAARRIGKPAFNQERSTFDTVTHDIQPFGYLQGRLLKEGCEKMVNGQNTMR